MERKLLARLLYKLLQPKLFPNVHMNPILLKPENDTRSQVIIHGEVSESIQGNEYFSSSWLKRKYEAISQSVDILKKKYDLIIAEGAGSCAEPNFMADDLVNLGLAELLDANAYIVVNIDKGGVRWFLSLGPVSRFLKLIASYLSLFFSQTSPSPPMGGEK